MTAPQPHSAGDTSPLDRQDERRDRLVLAALEHVPFDGWSRSALLAAAATAGLDPTLVERLFPGGPLAAVLHFAALADRRLEDWAAQAEDAALLSGLRLPERLGRLIRQRLGAWTGHKEAVRRAVSLLSLPHHVPAALRSSWRTVDSLWWTAGDSATDFSFYTRRATLTAIYGATLLVWLEDESEDAADSWGFLDRRLAEAGRLPRLKAELGHRLARLPDPRTLFRPAGKPRFGLR